MPITAARHTRSTVTSSGQRADRPRRDCYRWSSLLPLVEPVETVGRACRDLPWSSAVETSIGGCVGSRQARSAGCISVGRACRDLLGGCADLDKLDRRGCAAIRRVHFRWSSRCRWSSLSRPSVGRACRDLLGGCADLDRLDQRGCGDLDKLDRRGVLGSRQARSAGCTSAGRACRDLPLVEPVETFLAVARISTGSISGVCSIGGVCFRWSSLSRPS